MLDIIKQRGTGKLYYAPNDLKEQLTITMQIIIDVEITDVILAEHLGLGVYSIDLPKLHVGSYPIVITEWRTLKNKKFAFLLHISL